MSNSKKNKFRYTEIASYAKNPFGYELRYGSEKAEILKNFIMSTPKLKEIFFPDPTPQEIENKKYAETLFYSNLLKERKTADHPEVTHAAIEKPTIEIPGSNVIKNVLDGISKIFEIPFRFSFAFASSEKNIYPLETSRINIETWPSDTDRFWIKFIIKSESNIIIEFYSKLPITDRKFILYAESQKGLVELILIKDIRRPNSITPYTVSISEKNKFDWRDPEQRLFLQQVE